MTAPSLTPDASTFSGTVVRSLRRIGTLYREYFQWFDADKIERTSYPILGDLVVDEFTFANAPKLGPAIIYERELHVLRPSELVDYFARNSAVVADSRRRASVESAPDFEWPTDEEYVAGFNEIYPPDYLETSFLERDAIWDEFAMRSYKWFGARAIARRADDLLEVVCWDAESPRVKDVEILNKTTAHLLDLGLEVVDGLIELFDTHALRPQSGMVVFEIGRRSALEPDAYLRRF